MNSDYKKNRYVIRKTITNVPNIIFFIFTKHILVFVKDYKAVTLFFPKKKALKKCENDIIQRLNMTLHSHMKILQVFMLQCIYIVSFSIIF